MFCLVKPDVISGEWMGEQVLSVLRELEEQDQDHEQDHEQEGRGSSRG
jgi:hypothetical protein